jgi:hypothetical protein
MNKFVQIPCGCHCLALAIKDLRSNNEMMNRAMILLEIFSVLLNTNPILAILKGSGHSRCLTRCTNIYNIAALVVSHLDELSFEKMKEMD